MIQLLLGAGTGADALINVQDREGKTALMYACNSGDPIILLPLLEAGADYQYLLKNSPTGMNNRDEILKAKYDHSSVNK